jgi:enoyl-CoA hydratase
LSPVLTVEHREIASGRVELWSVHRPDKLNALNSQVLKILDQEAERLFQQLETDPMCVRALILKGSGDKAFVAGADIAEMNHFSASQATEFSTLGQTAMSRLEALPLPVIAAVQGFCLGGGLELAMCCDFRLLHASAQLGQPEAQLGLIPGFGATLRLCEKLGPARALDLFMSCRRLSATEALELGLAERITESDLEAAALVWADELVAKSSPRAVWTLKKLIWNQPHRRQMLSLEAQAFGAQFATKDKAEGVAAFLEKRKPKFSGH